MQDLNINMTLVPYSGKFSLGANFRDFRRQTCFHENKNGKKKFTKMKVDDVITCVRRYALGAAKFTAIHVALRHLIWGEPERAPH